MKPLYASACSTVLLATAIVGCGGNSERTGDTLEVTVIGTPTAWSNITAVEVQGKRVTLPPSGVPPRDLVADVFLCTADIKRFLSMESFAVRVTKADGQTTDSKVERIACRFTKNPGYMEIAQVRLEDDGHIDADFSKGRSDVWTSCLEGDTPWLCAIDEL